MDKKLIIGLGVIGILAFMILLQGNSNDNTILENEGEFKIPLGEISDEAEFYEHAGYKFFVVKARDGSIKTAFDACTVCGGSKGYRQEGNDMVCNNCGLHFQIASLGEKNINGGGCWPAHLEAEIQEDYLIIQKSDISKGFW